VSIDSVRVSALRRRLAKAAFLAVLLVLTPAWLTLVPPEDVRAADTSVRFGPIPVRGDCRSYPGQSCTWDAWTGETTVSPKIVREGESISVSVSICCGAVSFQLPKMTGCTETKQPQDVEVKGPDGRWVLQKKDVVVASTCAMKPGPTRGGWATIGAGITGPCGSQIAVQEGRAEFAACGSAEDSDYYGVIPKEEELWAISGRVSAKDNRRIRGVLVELSGDERQAAVTSSSGDYAFLVKKGSYTVTTEEGFCASVDGSPVSGCSRSGSVSVPGSHSVDFRPAKEGIVKGTVLDAKGKGLRFATVSAVGKQGQTAVTDVNGAYTMTLVAGSYQVTAYGEWKAGKDAKGEPTLVRPVYCSSPIGDCAQRVTATVKGDDEQTINWNDRGIIGTPADEVAPQIADPTIDLSNPATIDLWFLASVLVAGGAGIAGAGVAAGGGDGSEDAAGGGGGGGGPDKPWSEMSEEERERFRSWFIERWKDAHPNASGEQLANLIGLLYDQPDGFWERTVQSAIDLGMSYWEDLSSGQQATGLGGTFYGIGTGFKSAATGLWDFGKGVASGGWNELQQLPAALREFPTVFGKDWASGGIGERFEGMFTYGAGVMDTAAKFWTDPDAMKEAITKYGPEVVNGFMSKAHELDKALMDADPLVIRQKIGEIAGNMEFGALTGDYTYKGILKADDLEKAAKYADDIVKAVRSGDMVDGVYTHVPKDLVLSGDQRALIDRGIVGIEDINKKSLNQTQRIEFDDGTTAILKPESGAVSSGYEPYLDGPKYARETGAYVTDQHLGFGQVPTTAVIDDPELGRSAVQAWQESQPFTGGAEAFSPIDQQKAAVLDYITGNLDRHAGNVLQSPDGKLIAIDHGECFPVPGTNDGKMAMTGDFVNAQFGQPLDPSVLEAVQSVDKAALTQDLLNSGLSQAQVDGALARLDEVATNGQITGEVLGCPVVKSGQGWVGVKFYGMPPQP